MRAIVATAFGDPSVLRLVDLPVPAPGPGQVSIRVAGAGVGPWDAKVRSGRFGPRTFPYVPGVEVSGTVEAVGPGVVRLAPGDAVLASPSGGGYAEVAVAAEAKAAAAPGRLDLADAGGVPIGANTALEGLDEHLHLVDGERLLVAGAGGGVGAFVVQLAKARGATVVATAGAASAEFLTRIGADLVLDYRGDWQPAASGVDAAFDCVGGPTWAGCVAAVREGGRAVSIVAFGDPTSRPGVEASTFSATVTRERLAEVARLIDAGQVRVEIAARLPLEEAAEAHRRIEAGHTRGKIVLAV